MNKLVTIIVCILIFGGCVFSDDYCIILVGLLFFICFYDLFRIYYLTGKIRLFDFKNFFLTNYFYIHGFGYFSYSARVDIGLNWYNHSPDLIEHSLIVAILAILILLLFYNISIHNKEFINSSYFVNRFKDIGYFQNLYNVNSKTWKKYTIWVVILFTLFWYVMGVIPFLTPGFHEAGRTELGKGLGLIEALSKSLLGLSILFYIWKIKKKGHFDKSTLVFFMFCVSIFILNDERGSLVYYIFSIAFVYYLCKGPISLQTYLLGFISVVVLAGGIGAMRSGGSREISGLERVAIEVATETSVEFDNYVETFNMFKNNDFLYGSTLIPIFTIPIPRIIFPEKNRYKTAGEYFKDYHGHDHIRVGERLTYVGELYMNWGYLGIIIGMSILGVFMGKIVKWSTKITKAIYLYLYMCIVNSTAALIAGDIATAIVGFMMSNFFVFIYILFKKKKAI